MARGQGAAILAAILLSLGSLRALVGQGQLAGVAGAVVGAVFGGPVQAEICW